MKKLLILRFSSFGDIIQGFGVPTLVKSNFPDCEVHWIVRSDFADIVQAHTSIDVVHSFDRKEGLLGLIRKALQLKSQGFTHVYDAHNNLRSHIFSFFLLGLWSNSKFIRRSKERINRFLLFKLRMNRFPWPYKGALSFVRPIAKWIPQYTEVLPTVQLETPEWNQPLPESFIALAPSAAWEMKRWPVEHWKDLIQQLPQKQFVLLGGPGDEFCAEIAAEAPDRVTNLAGRCSWLESCSVIKKSQALVSGDTGIMHLADLLGIKTFALIGPTAFGFPSYPNSKVLEVPLSCRPCTKDGR
ncbi:MAG: glycosyltransferase family 9 protein [Bdellovibrionales bacterium]